MSFNSLMRTLVFIASAISATAALVAQPRLTLDYPPMARTIVGRLALAAGERVVSIAHPGTFADLIPHLRYEVMRTGGIDLGVIDVLQEPVPATFEPAVLQKGAREARASLKSMLRDVDAAIMMPGTNTSHPAYLAMADWLKDDLVERRGRRTIHLHWIQAGGAYPIPGQPLPTRVAIDALYQRALVDTNYTALAESQRKFAAALRTGEVHITSPAGTDLRFRIGDRPVNFQDGDASRARSAAGVTLIDKEIELPAGAIRVAPIEESVEGVVAFPPSQWDGRPVEGLKLRFTRGRVVDITATSGTRCRRGRNEGGGRGRPRVPRVRARLQSAAGGSGAGAVDSLLRIRVGRGAALAGRQLRAGRRRHRRIRALEFLHRSHRHCGIDTLGARRADVETV